MIRIIKIGDLIYENIEPFVIDENGNKIWNIPEDENELRSCVIDTLNWLTDRYFYGEAEKRGGYKNMGEIVHDAGEEDPDAQFLLKLYDAIWEKEEELENQIDSMSLEELLNLNIEAWVKPLYDQIVAELENTADSTTDNTTDNTSEG